MSIRRLMSLVVACLLSGVPAFGAVCLTACESAAVAPHHARTAQDALPAQDHAAHAGHQPGAPLPATATPADPTLDPTDSCPCCDATAAAFDATVTIRRSSVTPDPTRTPAAIVAPDRCSGAGAGRRSDLDRLPGTAPPPHIPPPLLTLRI